MVDSCYQYYSESIEIMIHSILPCQAGLKGSHPGFKCQIARSENLNMIFSLSLILGKQLLSREIIVIASHDQPRQPHVSWLLKRWKSPQTGTRSKTSLNSAAKGPYNRISILWTKKERREPIVKTDTFATTGILSFATIRILSFVTIRILSFVDLGLPLKMCKLFRDIVYLRSIAKIRKCAHNICRSHDPLIKALSWPHANIKWSLKGLLRPAVLIECW